MACALWLVKRSAWMIGALMLCWLLAKRAWALRRDSASCALVRKLWKWEHITSRFSMVLLDNHWMCPGVWVSFNACFFILCKLEEVKTILWNHRPDADTSISFRWLPIMKAYEKGAPAYFATPPVNLIYAYHASLHQITRSSPSLEERFKLHREASNRVKDTAKQLGLKQLPLDPAYAANGMTAVRLPQLSPAILG